MYWNENFWTALCIGCNYSYTICKNDYDNFSLVEFLIQLKPLQLSVWFLPVTCLSCPGMLFLQAVLGVWDL